MAEGTAVERPRTCRTICVPIAEEQYVNIVDDPQVFRRWIEELAEQMPELFPENISQGFQFKDRRCSKKLQLWIRRIELADGSTWSVRPSFVMPGMVARTDDVQNGLFLRKFGVPFWAIAHVFGRDHMFWYRAECALGRFSLVGTTVRKVDVPEHLLADEHHQKNNREKRYIATTVAEGCVLGAAVAQTAGTEDLTKAYDAFRQEAHNVDPEYAPQTVNTDGWASTQAAWKTLFPMIAILQCFLHAWLKIRDRGKHLGDLFYETSQRVWDVYHATNKKSCAQRIRSLKNWAEKHLTGVVREKVLDLCRKRRLWTAAWDHPDGHRTSNMLDRLMRGMNRYFEDGQHLHGSRAANERHCRGWALLWNFAPWHPAIAKANQNHHSPAERLNGHRYHDQWLQNLLISASCGGYRYRIPQNP
jgi:hypothetical protein